MANHHLVLVSGMSTTGKSNSLENLRDPDGVLYLNCETNKALPFAAKFRQKSITDPYEIFDVLEKAEASDKIHTIVIDTATFLMEMFETQVINTAEDTRAAWGEYASYWKTLCQEYFARSTKKIAVLAHTAPIVNEDKVKEIAVKVKGSLMNQGIEAFFSLVVSTKVVDTHALEEYENKLLNITEDDEIDGFKYVYQTRKTSETRNERMRAPRAMWARNETFIDNDLQAYFDRITEFYGLEQQ